jgi:hypothetical protein
MLKTLKSPLVRSSVVLALVCGVGVWNFRSTADGSCLGVCFPSKYVWMNFKGHGIKGDYIVAAFPNNYGNCFPVGEGGSCLCLFQHAVCISWLGKNTTGQAARTNTRISVCLGFFPPCKGCRLCPCSGCTNFCSCPPPASCTFYNLSNASVIDPSGPPSAWVKYNKGLCVACH